MSTSARAIYAPRASKVQLNACGSCISSLSKLLSLDPSEFSAVHHASHCRVKNSDQLLVETCLPGFLNDLPSGTVAILPGADLSEAAILLNHFSTDGCTTFDQAIVTFLPLGGDTYDPGRFASDSPNEDLHAVRLRSYHTSAVIKHGRYIFAPSDKLDEAMKFARAPISLVYTHNSAVSLAGSAIADILEMSYIHNFKIGSDCSILDPKWFDISPSPEELKSVSAACDLVENYEYGYQLKWYNKKEVVFVPSCRAGDVQKSYHENTSNWIGRAAEFYVSKNGMGLKLEQIKRLGVMVCKQGTVVLSGKLYSHINASTKLIGVVVPVSTIGPCDYKYSVVVVDRVQAISLAKTLRTRIDTGDIPFDASLKEAFYKDATRVDAAYAQLSSHVLKLSGGNLSYHIENEIPNSDLLRAAIAILSFCHGWLTEGQYGKIAKEWYRKLYSEFFSDGFTTKYCIPGSLQKGFYRYLQPGLDAFVQIDCKPLLSLLTTDTGKCLQELFDELNINIKLDTTPSIDTPRARLLCRLIASAYTDNPVHFPNPDEYINSVIGKSVPLGISLISYPGHWHVKLKRGVILENMKYPINNRGLSVRLPIADMDELLLLYRDISLRPGRHNEYTNAGPHDNMRPIERLLARANEELAEGAEHGYCDHSLTPAELEHIIHCLVKPPPHVNIGGQFVRFGGERAAIDSICVHTSKSIKNMVYESAMFKTCAKDPTKYMVYTGCGVEGARRAIEFHAEYKTSALVLIDPVFDGATRKLAKEANSAAPDRPVYLAFSNEKFIAGEYEYIDVPTLEVGKPAYELTPPDYYILARHGDAWLAGVATDYGAKARKAARKMVENSKREYVNWYRKLDAHSLATYNLRYPGPDLTPDDRAVPVAPVAVRPNPEVYCSANTTDASISPASMYILHSDTVMLRSHLHVRQPPIQVPRTADLMPLRPRAPNQSDHAHHAAIGREVQRAAALAARVMINRQMHVYTGYYLYDDACTENTEPPLQQIHLNAEKFLKKLTLSRAEGDRLHTGYHVYITPTGSTTEFRVGNFKTKRIENLCVAANGIRREICEEGYSYRFEDLERCARRSVFSQTNCGRVLCACCTVLVNSACPILYRAFQMDFVHSNAGASRLHSYLDTPASKEAERYFEHKESTYYSQDLQWFNQPAVQDYCFTLHRRTIQDPEYTHPITEDPIPKLIKNKQILAITAIAGCGKSRLVRSRTAGFIAPYRKVTEENTRHFAFAATFEVGVTTIQNHPSRLSMLIIDEAHAMGPLVYYYLDYALKHDIKVYLLGDPWQINWAYRVKNGEEETDIFPFELANHACSAKVLFSVPCEFSRYSRRFGPRTARIISILLGIKVYGLNENQSVDLVCVKNLTEAIALSRDREYGYQQIALTQDAKQLLGEHALTAAEAGGMNVNDAEVFALPYQSALPFAAFVDQRAHYPHLYVAITRASRRCVIYCVAGVMGLDRNIITETKPRIPEVFTVIPPINCALHSKPILGFSGGRVVTCLGPEVPELVRIAEDNNYTYHVADEGPMTKNVDLIISTDLTVDYRTRSSVVIVPNARALRRLMKIKYPSDGNLKMRRRDSLWLNQRYSKISEITRLVKDATEATANMESPIIRELLQDRSTQLRRTALPCKVLPISSIKMVGLAYEQVTFDQGRVTVGEAVGRTTPDAALLSTGLLGGTFTQVVPTRDVDAYSYYDAAKDQVRNVFDEYIVDTSTGQFTKDHQALANTLISTHYEVATTQPTEPCLTVYIGQYINWEELISQFNGVSIRLNLLAIFAEIPDRKVYLLTNTPATKYQYDNAATSAACALVRYGKMNHQAYMQSLSAKTLREKLSEETAFFDTMARAASTLFTTSPLVNVDGVEFACAIKYLLSQFEKGKNCIAPTVSDLEESPNSLSHGMKVQGKHPDEYKLNSLQAMKCGQPVQVSSPAWMAYSASSFRTINELLHMAMGPRLQFMGPFFTLDRLHAKLNPHIDWRCTSGFDISECDASHIPNFARFVEQLMSIIYPSVERLLWRRVFFYLELVMGEWRCRTKDGSVKSTIRGQLASGTPWTFLWNCLWSLFNILVCLYESEGPMPVDEGLRTRREKDFIRKLASCAFGIAGDDGIMSTPGFTNIITKNYVTAFRVTIKLTREPHAVVFCHSTFTAHGVFADPVRALSKFMAKATDGSVESLDEIRQALNVLFAPYRATQRAAALIHARQLRFGALPQVTSTALDLIFRLVNTPAKKLQKLLVPCVLKATHF